MSLIINIVCTQSSFLFCIRKLEEFHIHVTNPLKNSIYCCRWSGKTGMKYYVKMHKQIQRHIVQCFEYKRMRKIFFRLFCHWYSFPSNEKRMNTKFWICWRFFSSQFIVFNCYFLVIGRKGKGRKNSFENSWHIILSM